MKPADRIILFLCLVTGFASAAYAQPANDDLANAVTIFSLPFVDTRPNANATLEPEEAAPSQRDVGEMRRDA